MKIFNRSILFIASAFALTLFSCSEEEKIIGLDYAAKYGKIAVTFEGTRLDEKAFKTTKVFQFLPDSGPDYSMVYGDATVKSFEVQRMHGAVDNIHNDNYAYFYLSASSGVPTSCNFYVGTFNIDSDDIYYYLSENFSLTPENITNYNYNEETGKLTYQFSVVVPAINSSTAHDLTITGSVNVTVFKNIAAS